MQDLPEDQHEQASKIFDQVWQQFSAKLYDRLPKAKLTQEQLFKLRKLAEGYSSEIAEAFEEKGSQPPPNVTTYIVLLAMARFDDALKRAPTTFESKRMRQRVVKLHVEGVIEEYIQALDEWVYHANSQELLLVLLCVPQSTAEQLIDCMTLEQARGAFQLHVAAATGRRYFSYKPPPDPTPKNFLDWLAMRLYDRIKCLLRDSLGQGDALFFWVSDRPLTVKNTEGELINYADPVNAKVIETWDREMNKHGHLNDDRKAKGRISSAGRIADSLSPSAKEIRRYLKEDVPVKLTPDGKGGVHIEVTDDGILASIKAVAGQKPGRKPKHTP